MKCPDGPKISVVVPVHNAGEDFRRCLSSIARAVSPADEIIVVADGDSDGSWRLAEASGARVVRMPSSGGPARARNVGAAEAAGDVIVFIDADITIPADAVARMRDAFRSDPGLAALFGSYDDEPSDHHFLSQYKNLFHHYVHQTANEQASTFWTGCGAIRREVFVALAGFDESFRRPSIEDIELGYRLVNPGYRIRLVKELQVKHLKRWGIVSLLRSDILYRAVPWTVLILREGRILNDLNLKHAYRLSIICVFLLVATVPAALREPRLCFLAALLMAALLVLNWDLYRFFSRRRGVLFALKTIPWNWLYYLYSGVAFSVGFVMHRIKLD